jgi:hypothetical protein
MRKRSSDEELYQQAREGSEEAARMLLARWRVTLTALAGGVEEAAVQEFRRAVQKAEAESFADLLDGVREKLRCFRQNGKGESGSKKGARVLPYDDALAVRARVDPQAAEQLFIKWKPLVYKIALKYRGAMPVEEAVEASMRGFLAAVRLYNPDKARFEQFVAWKCAYEVKEELRKYNRNREGALDSER